MYFYYEPVPDPLPPAALDDYLERGYFRMGGGMYREDLTYHEGRFLNSFRTRLSLHALTFSKSQRKLLRRNAEFRTVVTNDTVDSRHFDLERRYRNYRGRHPEGTILDVIRDADGISNPFTTKQIQIYHQERLIGYSFFDVGERYGASLLAVFEPEFANRSLGYWTMLLEMQWLQQEGFDFYSPGSVTPGQRAMDYKRRIGALDYYNVYRQCWLPLRELNEARDLAGRTVERRMLMLGKKLVSCGIPVGFGLYPLYGIAPEMFEERPLGLRNYAAPLALWLLPNGSQEQFILLYDFSRRGWMVYHIPTLPEGFEAFPDEWVVPTITHYLAYPNDHSLFVTDEQILGYAVNLCVHYLDRIRA